MNLAVIVWMRHISLSIFACLFLLLTPLLSSCSRESREEAPPPVTRDLDSIVSGSTLNALMTFNSTSYFIYRGEPMGFELELLQQFAEDHDLALKIDVVRDGAEILPRVNRGEADVAAVRLFRREVKGDADLRYTVPIHATRAAVVQRTGPPSEVDMPQIAKQALELKPDPEAQLPAKRVDSPSDLAGRRIYIPIVQHWRTFSSKSPTSRAATSR